MATDLREGLAVGRERDDVVMDNAEFPKGNLLGFVTERWLKKTSLLHAHIRVCSIVGEPNPENICLLFRYDRFHEVLPLDDACAPFVPLNHFVQDVETREKHVEVKGVVLVNVGQNIEHGQAVADRVLAEFPAMVRLRLLNDCPGLATRIEAPERVLLSTRLGTEDKLVKRSFVQAERESRPSVGRVIASREYKLPHKMVEGRTEIMDNVSADDAETEWPKSRERWLNTYNIPRFLKAVIEENWVGVRLEEGVSFRLQSSHVVLCSGDLFPNPVESQGVPVKKKDKQKTPQGHEIPVPKKDEFFDKLKKAASPSRQEPADPERAGTRSKHGAATPSTADSKSDADSGREKEKE